MKQSVHKKKVQCKCPLVTQQQVCILEHELWMIMMKRELNVGFMGPTILSILSDLSFWWNLNSNF